VEDLSVITRPFALTIDDYHCITSPEIHHAMSTMVQNLPEALRVFIISRTDPPLPLARLQSRTELLEINQEDLQFTDDEALTLMQRFDGLEVTPGEVLDFNERAEGWVAGLQLVSHVLRGYNQERIRRFAAEFSGSVRLIEKYLWEEVIGLQSDAVQSFLLKTSILPQFSAPLCDAVTQSTDSAATIRQLEQDRLFLVSLDDVGNWYRYHHLFSDVLRERLAQSATEAEIANLHCRAAEWLERQEFFEDSARHAVAGHDWERAIRLLEEIGSELWERDRIATLCNWLLGLPADVLERSPRLAFWLAYALGRQGRFEQAVQPLRIVERAWTVDADPIDMGWLRLLQGLLNLELDIDQSRDLLRDALRLLPDDHQGEQAIAHCLLGYSHFLRGECVEAESHFANARVKANSGKHAWVHFSEMAGSGGVLMLQGKLHDAAVLFRRVVKLDDDQFTLGSQQSLCRLGEVCLEWNNLDEAEGHFLHGESRAEQTRAILWRCDACLGLAKVAWARGEFEAAFDEVERAIDFGTQTGVATQIRFARAYQARIWLAAGQRSLARRWADSSDLDPCLPPEFPRIYEHLTFVRLLIAEDQSRTALDILEAIGSDATAMGRCGDLLEVLVLQAIAYESLGQHGEALDCVESALTFAEPNGYIRVFVDEGEQIAQLLRHAATRGTYPEYARMLLTIIVGSKRTPDQVKLGVVDALSEREIEVMRLVSAGLSNRDIGDQLFISEKTVKKHISNILCKLEATNRTQAVDQARRMALI
jgi:LuxR family maltose regulon positive regulatory protein